MGESQFFVKIDEFKSIFDLVKTIKNKVVDAHKNLDNIYHMKQEEEKLLDQWKEDLEEVERKVGFVEGVLFTQE